MAAGATLVGAKNAWSITGDFSFLAAGVLGVNECLSLQVPLKLIIFQNRVASATGGQPVSENLMNHFISSFHKDIVKIPISSPAQEFQLQLERMQQSQKMEILLIQCTP